MDPWSSNWREEKQLARLELSQLTKSVSVSDDSWNKAKPQLTETWPTGESELRTVGTVMEMEQQQTVAEELDDIDDFGEFNDPSVFTYTAATNAASILHTAVSTLAGLFPSIVPRISRQTETPPSSPLSVDSSRETWARLTSLDSLHPVRFRNSHVQLELIKIASSWRSKAVYRKPKFNSCPIGAISTSETVGANLFGWNNDDILKPKLDLNLCVQEKDKPCSVIGFAVGTSTAMPEDTGTNDEAALQVPSGFDLAPAKLFTLSTLTSAHTASDLESSIHKNDVLSTVNPTVRVNVPSQTCGDTTNSSYRNPEQLQYSDRESVLVPAKRHTDNLISHSPQTSPLGSLGVIDMFGNGNQPNGIDSSREHVRSPSSSPLGPRSGSCIESPNLQHMQSAKDGSPSGDFLDFTIFEKSLEAKLPINLSKTEQTTQTQQWHRDTVKVDYILSLLPNLDYLCE